MTFVSDDTEHVYVFRVNTKLHNQRVDRRVSIYTQRRGQFQRNQMCRYTTSLVMPA